MTRHAPSQPKHRSLFTTTSSSICTSTNNITFTTSNTGAAASNSSSSSSRRKNEPREQSTHLTGDQNALSPPQQKLKHQVIAGGQGFAFHALKGTRFRVMDMYGSQVVDMVAWPLSSSTSASALDSALGSQATAKLPSEHLSTSVTRYRLAGNPPMIGECLYTNAFRPLLRLRQDLCGTHDMTYMCCAPEMYKLLGIENHRSCAVNICNAVNEYFASKQTDGSSSTTSADTCNGLTQAEQDKDKKKKGDSKSKVMQSHLEVPDPFNTFQNTPNYSLKPRAASRAGDYVDWEVLEDCLVALSSCPYTLVSPPPNVQKWAWSNAGEFGSNLRAPFRLCPRTVGPLVTDTNQAAVSIQRRKGNQCRCNLGSAIAGAMGLIEIKTKCRKRARKGDKFRIINDASFVLIE